MGATKQERGMSRRVARAEAENERLRGLLAIARSGIAIALNSVPRTDEFSEIRRSAEDALVRSDPDADPS